MIENKLPEITDISQIKDIRVTTTAGASCLMTPDKLADLMLAKISADASKKKVLGEIVNPFLVIKRLLSSSDNLNDIQDGVYYYVNGNRPINSWGYNAVLIQFTNLHWPTNAWQIAFDLNNSGVACRFSYFNTEHNKTEWRSWKSIVTVPEN